MKPFREIHIDVTACSGKVSIRWCYSVLRAVSSGGERYLDTVEVTGSKPVSPTIENTWWEASFLTSFFFYFLIHAKKCLNFARMMPAKLLNSIKKGAKLRLPLFLCGIKILSTYITSSRVGLILCLTFKTLHEPLGREPKPKNRQNNPNINTVPRYSNSLK